MKGTLGVPVPSHLNKDKAVSSEQHGQCFSHSCWQTTQEVMPVLPVNSGANQVNTYWDLPDFLWDFQISRVTL